ncbi:SgcJ/EcaC family oxidoreductase [Luteipulveratus sp. YIM 133132]|uniref:SgcJ/EcaC family oxidoreductase n=1 Tax=Luteipulveratus flavus TaxID=3031728 RepID=UPI0023B1F3F6|nr:SgcJ/EcaC family oxidoreductase [Luteipulveratus sp. YIM 133132]MDE9367879.1 SgcJ/EcaC family oxidoreductase [Luteipulveratus sp. YIM 133132]
MTIDQHPAGTTSPETVARHVLNRLESAWNEADGEAFGSCYAQDATFVTIRGERIVGRAAIAAGHAGIFSTIYAGSVNRMELVSATEIAGGVVLVDSVSTLDCPTGPLAGVHRARSTSVVLLPSDGAGSPSIVSGHNTLVTA